MTQRQWKGRRETWTQIIVMIPLMMMASFSRWLKKKDKNHQPGSKWPRILSSWMPWREEGEARRQQLQLLYMLMLIRFFLHFLVPWLSFLVSPESTIPWGTFAPSFSMMTTKTWIFVNFRYFWESEFVLPWEEEACLDFLKKTLFLVSLTCLPNLCVSLSLHSWEIFSFFWVVHVLSLLILLHFWLGCAFFLVCFVLVEPNLLLSLLLTLTPGLCLYFGCSLLLVSVKHF